MKDEAMWKRRFLLFSAARIGGVAVLLFGLAVAFTDLVQPGGFRGLGALLIAIGSIEMVVVPLILRAAWHKE